MKQNINITRVIALLWPQYKGHGGLEERQNGKKEIYLHWKGSWLSLALLSYGLPYGLNRKMKWLTMLWYCPLVRSSKMVFEDQEKGGEK